MADDDALTAEEQAALDESKADTGEEAEQAEEAQAEAQQPTSDKVPHGAFHAEREQRKRAEQELREARSQMTRMEERFTQFTQQFQQAPQQQPQPPSYDDDPIGYLRHGLEQTQQTIGQIAETMRGAVQMGATQGQAQQFMQRYHGAAQEFAQAHPDFAQAYQHLMATRHEELAEIGYSQEARAQTIQAEEYAIVKQAFDQGRNPAEILYALATRRGFKVGAAQNGKAGEPSPADDKLDRLERGEAAAKSPSAQAGTAPRNLTLAGMAAMDDEDFGAITDQQWRKMFGGS